MGIIRPDEIEKTVRALLRRHSLLRAYLDAVIRIDGPNHRRRAAELRRPRRDITTFQVLHFSKGAPNRWEEAPLAPEGPVPRRESGLGLSGEQRKHRAVDGIDGGTLLFNHLPIRDVPSLHA